MWRAVEQAARRVVEMTAEDLKPRDILTPGAFANAVTTVLSVSGSINSVKHLQAVAAEAECGADVYRLFRELAGPGPLLAAVRPHGEGPLRAVEDAAQGPAGSPGMGMASQLVFALDGAGLPGQVAVVPDGQLSGLVNKGIVVGEVSPEAARGGPLALVSDGDLIRIDVPARTADLDVPAAELRRRRDALRAPARTEERGWLSIYQRLVRPLPEGAVLREPAP